MGYKVGDWIKNRHTGYMLEIIEVIRTDDGIHQYRVKEINKDYPKINLLNYMILQSFYELLPLARLLYTKKVTSEVANENDAE